MVKDREAVYVRKPVSGRAEFEDLQTARDISCRISSSSLQRTDMARDGILVPATAFMWAVTRRSS